jgi:hypothetical protein
MSDKYNQNWVMLLAQPNVKTWAITIGQTTYYSESKEYVDARPRWRKHEECHKFQWKREGFLKFAKKYLENLKKYGYYNNPFEVEAREAENK